MVSPVRTGLWRAPEIPVGRQRPLGDGIEHRQREEAVHAREPSRCFKPLRTGVGTSSVRLDGWGEPSGAARAIAEVIGYAQRRAGEVLRPGDEG